MTTIYDTKICTGASVHTLRTWLVDGKFTRAEIWVGPVGRRGSLRTGSYKTVRGILRALGYLPGIWVRGSEIGVFDRRYGFIRTTKVEG